MYLSSGSWGIRRCPFEIIKLLIDIGALSENSIARVSFNKSQQINIARADCENLSSPKAKIRWCHVPQTLKKCFKN